MLFITIYIKIYDGIQICFIVTKISSVFILTYEYLNNTINIIGKLWIYRLKLLYTNIICCVLHINILKQFIL